MIESAGEGVLVVYGIAAHGLTRAEAEAVVQRVKAISPVVYTAGEAFDLFDQQVTP